MQMQSLIELQSAHYLTRQHDTRTAKCAASFLDTLRSIAAAPDSLSASGQFFERLYSEGDEVIDAEGLMEWPVDAIAPEILLTVIIPVIN